MDVAVVRFAENCFAAFNHPRRSVLTMQLGQKIR